MISICQSQILIKVKSIGQGKSGHTHDRMIVENHTRSLVMVKDWGRDLDLVVRYDAKLKTSSKPSAPATPGGAATSQEDQTGDESDVEEIYRDTYNAPISEAGKSSKKTLRSLTVPI